MLRDRPAMAQTDHGPVFEVRRNDADTGEWTWMVALPEELTEDELAALSEDEREIVAAALAVDDPEIGAVHNAQPSVALVLECAAAAAE